MWAVKAGGERDFGGSCERLKRIEKWGVCEVCQWSELSEIFGGMVEIGG